MGKIIQLVAAPQDGGIILFALDDLGQVWSVNNNRWVKVDLEVSGLSVAEGN